MARFTLLSTFLLLATGQVLANLVHTIPNRYILELEETHDVFARDASPVHIHKRMYNTFESRGLDYKVHHEYGSPGVLVGMSVTLQNPSDFEKLQSIPGVRSITPVTQLERSAPLNKRTRYEAYDPKTAPVTDALHYMTGVDKLHAAGITGKGVKIGIIDTGVDYKNPALGGGLGEGFHIAGGYDYTGDDPDHPKPDMDPSDCNGHGTHVAGIIGALPGKGFFNLTGVAYEAELHAYKVGACEGGLPTDAIVKSLTQSHEDGCDVVNLSLGSPGGWAWDPTNIKQEIINRLAALGRIIVVAAGNEGADGSWYASGPGGAEGAITVANIQSPVVPLQSATVVIGDEATIDPIVYYDVYPMTNRTDPLPVYAFNNASKYGCGDLPKDVPNLENYLVVTKYACDVEELLENLGTKGVKQLFLYGTSRFEGLGDKFDNFAGALIQTADGEFLVDQFFKKQKVTVTFPKGGALVNFKPTDAELVSPSSTYGPTFDLRFKPALGAYGGRILSTVPLQQEGFGIKSGTSMAAPYVAGCAALFVEARGKNKDIARQAKELFQTTSITLLANHSDESLLQTATVQGAGIIDAYAATYASTIISPAELLLNDSRYFQDTQTFTVKNVGNKEKKYSVDHFPAGTAITIKPSSIQPSKGPVKLVKSYASVELSTESFTLAPNQVQTITAKFSPPKDLDPKTLPVYSGFIQVEAEGEGDMGKFHVSYMGVAGALIDQQVLDTTGEAFDDEITLPAIITGNDAKGNPIVQEKEQTYDFTNKDQKAPRLVYRLAFGSPLVTLDVVPPSFSLDNMKAPLPIIGRIMNDTFASRNNEDEDGVVTKIPLDNDAAFSNNTYVPSGTYKVLLSALRVTGDPSNLDHYDYWLSPAMTFKYTKNRVATAGGSTDDVDEVGAPIYKKPWFIAVISVAGFLVVAGAAAGAVLLARRRKSTIPSEAAFVPAMGAYKPLVDDSRNQPSYTDTSYQPRGGQYSDS
ncbi:hypothetical protein AAF712_014247 [Marasmius tenuissimus]|uniref:Uncharacterized protein n=1 Tax=Marasmius tenuissimus TaxID=585030 RepID=A0ABR2ZDQ3_9AGAR